MEWAVFMLVKLGFWQVCIQQQWTLLIWHGNNRHFFYIYEIFSQILYPIFFRYLCSYILLWYGPKKRPCYLLCVSTHYFFFLEKSTITRESLWKEKIPCEEMSLEKFAYLHAKTLNILNQNWFERVSKNIAKTVRHLNNANFS